MRAAVVPALLVVAALTTACGGSAHHHPGAGGGDGDGRGGGTPTGEPPGTPITTQLSTPPGTLLLGTPFGYADAPGGEVAGVDALLLVTGDPVAAFAGLVEQLSAAGPEPLAYHPDEDADPAFCEVADVTYPDAVGDRWPVGSPDVPADGPLSLECAAHAFGPDGHRLDLRLVVSEHADPYLSFVQVTEVYDTPSSPLPDLEAPAPPPDAESPVTPPPLPELPAAGDPIGEPFAPSGEEYRLLDGFALVAPPAMSTCATGGFVAVVRITDGADLDTAVDAYVEHLAEAAFAEAPAPASDVTTDVDGVPARRVVLSGAGAGTVTVTGAGEHLLLDRCND